MATITSTTLEVYKGTSVIPGNLYLQKTEQGSPASISIGSLSLGGNDCLMPGSQYSVIARCINSESYISDWTALYPFKTLISIKWAENGGGNPDVTLYQAGGEWRLGIGQYSSIDDGSDDGSTAGTICYDSNIMSVDAAYVYVNTTNNLSTAVRLVTDEQELTQTSYYVTNSMLSAAGAQFTLQENSTYYVWLGVTDDAQTASRTYTTSSASVTSGAAAPVVTITNPTHTYNSVGATVNVTSSETISSITATLTPTGGGTIYTKNLSTSSPQTVTFADRDTDAGGNTVSIASNTEYRLTVTVVTPTHPSTSNYTNITTDSQAVSTIAINSVSNISPSGATVNLVYGSGQ